MSLPSNSQSNSQNNPQLLQQRLSVREQEISALKVQNRHLLSRIDELENASKPNQINTHFISEEVKKHLDPIIAQMQSTMTTSFEVLQSTMRGIYQQSSRAEKAVEEMTAHTRDLEMRTNDSRKLDQNFYQDKIFAMMGTFCDRVERQIETRLKALSAIEVMNAKQNEVLRDVDNMKATLLLLQKSSEAGRGDVSRIERNSTEANEKMIDVQVQTQNAQELTRDTLQQVKNHRSEFRLIRSELQAAVEYINKISRRLEADAVDRNRNAIAEVTALNKSEVEATGESNLINELIENKHRELEAMEKNIESQGMESSKDDATMILALLRAQKSELQRVADEAKNFLKNNAAPANSISIEPISESNLDR